MEMIFTLHGTNGRINSEVHAVGPNRDTGDQEHDGGGDPKGIQSYITLYEQRMCWSEGDDYYCETWNSCLQTTERHFGTEEQTGLFLEILLLLTLVTYRPTMSE